MNGYGKKIRRDDNQIHEGVFQNDNLLDGNEQFEKNENKRFEDLTFNLNSYAQHGKLMNCNDMNIEVKTNENIDNN